VAHLSAAIMPIDSLALPERLRGFVMASAGHRAALEQRCATPTVVRARKLQGQHLGTLKSLTGAYRVETITWSARDNSSGFQRPEPDSLGIDLAPFHAIAFRVGRRSAT
jgi:hypothetical protein